MTLKVWNPGDFILAADINRNFQTVIAETMAAWFATLPATPGQPWNNGGTLAFS